MKKIFKTWQYSLDHPIIAFQLERKANTERKAHNDDRCSLSLSMTSSSVCMKGQLTRTECLKFRELFDALLEDWPNVLNHDIC